MNAGYGEVPRMTTHQWRDSIKSYFGTHVAPEKAEQLKETKNEIENKVKKILKLIKDEGEKGNSVENLDRESELSDHIRDFHKQYQSLYELYYNLTAELKEKFDFQEGHDGDLSTHSSSYSDSDHSSWEKASENGKQRNELQKWDESIKQELEAANDQVADLKQRLEDAYREKEGLRADTDKALGSIGEVKQFSEDLQAKAIQLKDEKSTMLVENGALKHEVESMKGVVSDLKQRLESTKERAADLTQGLGSAQEENIALASKNVEISNGMAQAQRVIQELTEEVRQLSRRSNDSEAGFSALKVIHEEFENEASDRIKGLEAQVTDLQSELDSLLAQKRELEQHFEDKANEAKQLGEEILGLQLVQTELQDQISELDRISGERGGEISVLLQKLEDSQSEATTQTDNLTVQLNNLQLEVDSLHAQRSNLEEQIKGKSDETKQLREENLVLQQGSTELQNQVFEWERKLKEKEGEISALREKLEDRKNEAAVQINDLLLELDSLRTKGDQLQLQIEEKNQEGSEYEKKIENLYLEKDHLAVQVNDLQVEVSSLLSQKGDVEEQIKIKNHEAEELREENPALKLMRTKLQDQILDLERMLSERGDELSGLLEKLEDSKNEGSAQITALMAQVNESQENLQVAQKKIEEMGEVYQRNIDSKDKMIHMLQRMAEELKKEVETGREEVTTLKTELSKMEVNHKDLLERLHTTESGKTDANVEKEHLQRAKSETTETMRRIQREQQGEIARLQDEINTIEFKLLLSNRKLHVTDQLLTDREENYRKKEEKFQQECKELQEQNAKLSSKIATAQRDLMEIRNTVEKMSNSFCGFELVFQKFQEDDSSLWNRIAEVSEALRIAKIWVTGRNIKKEELESTVASLVEQLQDKQEHEIELNERVGWLEVKVSEGGEEKERLMMSVTELEKKARELEKKLKEKEVEVLSLEEEKKEAIRQKEDEVFSVEEEKKEAIRQLCIWTEYNCEQIDYLKALLSKTRVSNQMTT